MAKRRGSTLVIGLGRFGTAIVEELWDAGVDVAVLDQDAEVIDAIKGRASVAFVGDATDPRVLDDVGLQSMDTVIVSFGSHFQAAVLCVTTLKECEVPYVVARAEAPRQRRVLQAVGADRVLEIERDMGKRFANELIAPVTRDLLELAEHYQVLPWEAHGDLVGKRLGEAQLRERYELNVIGYRPREEVLAPGERPTLHIPKVDHEIREGDTLVLVGEETQVNRFVENN